MTKRTPPPTQIDHAANLREKLGKVAYEAAFDHVPVPWSETDEARRERYRTIGMAVLEAMTNRRRGLAGSFEVVSGYSAQRNEPFVEVAVDLSPFQVSPAKARELGLLLLETAEEAESDALISDFAKQQIGLDQLRTAQLLDTFRKARQRKRGRSVDTA
jgi:hypothetical protein